MILDLYENDSKTLRVYKETYRKTHKLSGKVNPVYQFRIKVKRGLPANRASTGHTNKRLAIRHAEDKLKHRAFNLIHSLLGKSSSSILAV